MRWRDLPTLYHIVNTLADIEFVEFRGAHLTLSEGSTDQFAQLADPVVAELSQASRGREGPSPGSLTASTRSP
jgi:hypothetical protein